MNVWIMCRWKFVLTFVLIIKTVRSFYTLTIQMTPRCTEETSLTRQEFHPERTICVPFFVRVFFPFIFAKRIWTCPFCDLGIVKWLLTTGSSWIIRTLNCQWFANLAYMLWLFVVDLSPRTSNWSALWLTPLIPVIWKRTKTRFQAGRMLWICDVRFLCQGLKTNLNFKDWLPAFPDTYTIASNLRSMLNCWMFWPCHALRQIFAPGICPCGLLVMLRIGATGRIGTLRRCVKGPVDATKVSVRRNPGNHLMSKIWSNSRFFTANLNWCSRKMSRKAFLPEGISLDFNYWMRFLLHRLSSWQGLCGDTKGRTWWMVLWLERPLLDQWGQVETGWCPEVVDVGRGLLDLGYVRNFGEIYRIYDLIWKEYQKKSWSLLVFPEKELRLCRNCILFLLFLFVKWVVVVVGGPWLPGSHGVLRSCHQWALTVTPFFRRRMKEWCEEMCKSPFEDVKGCKRQRGKLETVKTNFVKL